MAYGFEEGRVYNRRRDIHDRFAGQQQGGIITPSSHNLVIVITGEEGAAHGYADRQLPDGVFEYFGEGQRGDMEMVRGNKHIRDHAENGRDLLLFRKTAEGLRFEGPYVCEGHHTEPAPDTEGAMRNAIVFELRPLSAIVEAIEGDELPSASEPLEELRIRAMEAARSAPSRGERTTTLFERSKAVRDYVFARAEGNCEHCGQPAPFITPKGRPYLEAHHIRRMTDGGPDDPRYVIAICPNCHRRAHYGLDARARNEKMQRYVSAIEELK